MTGRPAWAGWPWRLGALGVRRRAADLQHVSTIRQTAAALSSLSDNQLSERAEALRRLNPSTPSNKHGQQDSRVRDAFALVLEAARRALSIELYDVQLLAGLAMSRGAIAEMQTGEGKTLAATLPASAFALNGRGVHVVTPNQYLAERDFELLAPVYRLLGLTTGSLRPNDSFQQRQAAFQCDITYGPGYEFGFDFLRDRLAKASGRHRLGDAFRFALRGDREAPTRQRGHAAAIIDEADSVLIDEATTPLILSAHAQRASNEFVYHAAAAAADRLAQAELLDVSHHGGLSAAALQQLDAWTDAAPASGLERPWRMYVEQTARARLFQRDVHYVVRDDQILLVDQQTGRVFEDRSWRDGLQQAIQAKEKVTITAENCPLARITRQRFFGMYERLCGMTGTAASSQRELLKAFGMTVEVIPTHRPCARTMLPTRCFADRESKERAVIDEVLELHAAGRCILVGTASIDSSERLAQRLGQRPAQRKELGPAGVSFSLLNGKQDADEAAVVSGAGRAGAITIATNMAGRGTDIRLEPAAADRGGLHVIAVEPQESVRVDRQLFGRAARQGDPGSCRLFASADDRLLHHVSSLARRMRRLADATGEIAADLSKQIAQLQKRVEVQQSAARQRLFRHDDWLQSLGDL